MASASSCTPIREGRVTFANTIKYISTATSANFGNFYRQIKQRAHAA